MPCGWNVSLSQATISLSGIYLGWLDSLQVLIHTQM